jgi:hypothetical protein
MRALRRRTAIEDPEDGYTLAGEMLEEISSLPYLPPASPELRAALYRVMPRIEGVELLGERSDPLAGAASPSRARSATARTPARASC